MELMEAVFCPGRTGRCSIDPATLSSACGTKLKWGSWAVVRTATRYAVCQVWPAALPCGLLNAELHIFAPNMDSPNQHEDFTRTCSEEVVAIAALDAPVALKSIAIEIPARGGLASDANNAMATLRAHLLHSPVAQGCVLLLSEEGIQLCT